MNQQQFIDLLGSSARYHAWFKEWWEADYSVAGCRARGLKFPHAFSFVDFAGRQWSYGRSPPHDLEGRANPDFRPIHHQVPAGNALHEFGDDLSGTWIYGFDQRRLVTDNLSLARAFVQGDVSIGRQLSSLTLDDAYVDGAVSIGSSVGNGVSMARIFARGINLSNGRSPVDLSGAFVVETAVIDTTGHVDLRDVRCDGSVQTSGNVGAEGIHCASLQVAGFPEGGAGNLDGAHIRGRLTVSGRSPTYEISARNLTADSISMPNVNLRKIDLYECSVSQRIYLDRVEISELDLRSSNIRDIEGSQARIKFFRLDGANVSSAIGLPNVSAETIVFDRAECGSYCDLSGAKITQILRGEDARFYGRVGLSSAELPGALHFPNAVFASGLIVRAGVDSSSGTIGRANFASAHFAPAADEVCIDFDRRKTLEAATFDLARFKGLPEFYGCEFHENISFRGAVFEMASSPYRRESPVKIFLAALHALKVDFDSALYKFSNFRQWLATHENVANQLAENARLASYERAFNALRQRAEEINNTKYERLFHTYELRARRKRRHDRDSPAIENGLSWLYDVSSEYGQSVSRPLLMLVFAGWLGFAAIYWLLAGVWSFEAGLEALQFSGREIVKPFTVWSRDLTLSAVPTSPPAEVDPWIKALLSGGTPTLDLLKSLTVKLVGSMQSLLSLALLFLSGLAVRRAFGLS